MSQFHAKFVPFFFFAVSIKFFEYVWAFHVVLESISSRSLTGPYFHHEVLDSGSTDYVVFSCSTKFLSIIPICESFLHVLKLI